MAKNNFLLVDLNESKTKRLAEVITSETSRKILNHLAEKEETEANIAKELGMPISTAHYHLQKLREAGLVTVDEFHYSQKGREVNHYKLANKYIIITPRKISGLKQALKNILPVGLIVLGISGLIKIIRGITSFKGISKQTALAEEAVEEAAETMTRTTISSQPDIALWFLIGGLAAIGIYLAVMVIKEFLGEK